MGLGQARVKSERLLDNATLQQREGNNCSAETEPTHMDFTAKTLGDFQMLGHRLMRLPSPPCPHDRFAPAKRLAGPCILTFSGSIEQTLFWPQLLLRRMRPRPLSTIAALFLARVRPDWVVAAHSGLVPASFVDLWSSCSSLKLSPPSQINSLRRNYSH